MNEKRFKNFFKILFKQNIEKDWQTHFNIFWKTDFETLFSERSDRFTWALLSCKNARVTGWLWSLPVLFQQSYATNCTMHCFFSFRATIGETFFLFLLWLDSYGYGVRACSWRNSEITTYSIVPFRPHASSFQHDFIVQHGERRKTRVILRLFDQLRLPDDVKVHTFLSCQFRKSLINHLFYKQNRLLIFHCYENMIV